MADIELRGLLILYAVGLTRVTNHSILSTIYFTDCELPQIDDGTTQRFSEGRQQGEDDLSFPTIDSTLTSADQRKIYSGLVETTEFSEYRLLNVISE